MTQAVTRRVIWLSIAAALATLGLKTTAYLLTGSVGLFSDAAESVLNLVTACAACFSLWYASLPVDATHTYGHEKIEFFSSGLEGTLILAAAIGIGWYAALRLWTLTKLESLEAGIAVSFAATAINFIVARILLRVGRQQRSIVLEADGSHLMADVWTSLGVLVGLVGVHVTGMTVFDPLVAMIVASMIAYTGFGLVRRSIDGLMDHALTEQEQNAVRTAIEKQLEPQMDFHALRTRRAGARRFVDFHLLVPGTMSVAESHVIVGKVEDAVRAALADAEITIHVEPIEDRAAWEDSALVPLEQAARRKGQGGKEGCSTP